MRSLAALAFLLLGGCATTGTELPGSDSASTVPARITRPAPARASAIDDHLYVPPAAPAGSEYPNVWARAIDRFAMPECSAHEVNLEWSRWYAARPDYMERIFKRAQPWVHFIVEELERRGMPGEAAVRDCLAGM